MGKRRVFSREFKLEAVRLVVERGVKVSLAAKDLGIHENVLRKWVRDSHHSVSRLDGTGRAHKPLSRTKRTKDG